MPKRPRGESPFDADPAAAEALAMGEVIEAINTRMDDGATQAEAIHAVQAAAERATDSGPPTPEVERLRGLLRTLAREWDGAWMVELRVSGADDRPLRRALEAVLAEGRR